MKNEVKKEKVIKHPYGSLAAYEKVLSYNSKRLQETYYKNKHMFL